MSHRHEQVASTLSRAIQQVLARGLSDPRLDGCMLTVTAVEVPNDLRSAAVRVSVLPDKKQRLALHALRDASGYIRRQCGSLMAIAQVPELRFELDASLKKQAEVLDALRRVADEARPDADAPASPDSPAQPGSPNA